MIEIGGTCEFGTMTLSYFSVMMFWCAGHGGWLTDGAISMSGSQAVTSSGDELAVVWDLHQGNCLNVLEGHSGEVRSVVLTRRGRCASVFAIIPAQGVGGILIVFNEQQYCTGLFGC